MKNPKKVHNPQALGADSFSEKLQQAHDEHQQREAQERAARAVTMPGVLFELMVSIQKLSNAGFEIGVELVTACRQKEAEDSQDIDQPGIRVLFGPTFANKGDMVSPVYTYMSPVWRFELLKDKLKQLQDQYDARMRQKALAEEAKKLLTPEQLAALKQFG